MASHNDKTSVADSDAHFIIDIVTRAIQNASDKSEIVQFDHNSERLTFECSRYIEGHDMLNCNKVVVNYLCGDAYGIYEVDDLKMKDSNTVTFSWLISSNVTQKIGKIHFAIMFECVQTNGEVTYKWNTKITESMQIVEGMNYGNTIVYENTDILEQWKQQLFGTSDGEISKIQEATNECLKKIPSDYGDLNIKVDKNTTSISELKESLEIEKNHTETEYKEEVVPLEITEGQAISTDGELYSSAYARWGKAPVEGLCKIKVSGRSQQNKKYPLILYFDTTDKLLGSDCGDGTAKNYVDIELTTPLKTAYVKINGAQGTSTSVGPKLTKVSQLTVKEFLNKNNDNLLYGKKIVCIGDSIVKGQGYNGDTKGNKSYVDMIAEKNNMTCINYAVSGATIMSGTNETVFHICDNIETMDEDADYIIVGGGYNDHIYRGTIGSLTDDYTSEITNTSRIIGGTEYMCRKLLERYEGKKILFVFSHKIKDTPYTKINDYNNGSHTMTEVHDAIESVLKKYSMPYCDLYNISCFNTAISSYLKYTANNDGTHPTKEGYEKFYVPYVEAKLKLL